MEPATAARVLLAAGVRFLQFRHKGHFSRRAFETASRLAVLCREAGATLIIDDRSDIAALLDAGVHVGQDDLAPAAARNILGPDRLLGFSTHNAAQLRAGDAEPVDYLAIGPVFGTQSKERPDPAVGVEALAGLRALTRKPLVAIGGITRANALDILAGGADALAVIAGLLPDPLTEDTLRERIEEWQNLLK